MDNDVVISVSDVTKSYRLYNKHADRVKETFHPLRKKYHRNFDALRNVHFEVKRGETVGIIGRNGCGKSTLLQIVCGVLQPTSGSVRVNGKVSALLELGMGFNPEFTGFHNIYINGSILGLTREEIDERYEDIVSFADIGDFINQPVKSYSSGMNVRLAFAVAISIDPDILVVDEALAVGDEAFQRKCYARINQIQDKGGTILFVSHGAGTIVGLCNRALLFDQGELLVGGSPKQVIAHYHKLIYAPKNKAVQLKEEWRGYPDRFNLFGDEDEADDKDEPNKKVNVKLEDENKKDNQNQIENEKTQKLTQESFYIPDMIPKSTVQYEKRGAKIENPQIHTLNGRQVNVLVNKKEYDYTYSVCFERDAFQVRFGMLIKTVSGFEIGGYVSAPVGEGIECIEKETWWKVTFRFRCQLNPGTYFLNAGVLGTVKDKEVFLDRIIDVSMFKVQEVENRNSTAIVDLVDVAEVAMIEEAPNQS